MKQKLLLEIIYKCPFCWHTLGKDTNKKDWTKEVEKSHGFFSRKVYEVTCKNCGELLNLHEDAVVTVGPTTNILFRQFNL